MRKEISFRSGLKPQVDLMIASGVRAIVAGGSTGEGHTLSRDEFAAAMKVAHDAVAGRVPFVVGLIVNSTKEAVERFELLKGLDIAALQVTPVHYLFKPQLESTITHFRTIWEKTRTPILIYNVIPWNYLSPRDMLTIMDRVPGVVGIKQSSGDLKTLSDLLLDAKPENVILSGIDALLYPAFALGGHGAISALTSALPGVCVKLFNALHEATTHWGRTSISSSTRSGMCCVTTIFRPASSTSSRARACRCSIRVLRWSRSPISRRQRSTGISPRCWCSRPTDSPERLRHEQRAPSSTRRKRPCLRSVEA